MAVQDCARAWQAGAEALVGSLGTSMGRREAQLAEAPFRNISLEMFIPEACISVEQQAWLAEPRHQALRTEHDQVAAVSVVSELSDISEAD